MPGYAGHGVTGALRAGVTGVSGCLKPFERPNLAYAGTLSPDTSARSARPCRRQPTQRPRSQSPCRRQPTAPVSAEQLRNTRGRHLCGEVVDAVIADGFHKRATQSAR